MEFSINQLISKKVIIPYTEKKCMFLEGICQSYVSQNSFDDKAYTSLAWNALGEVSDDDLTKFINAKIDEESSNIIIYNAIRPQLTLYAFLYSFVNAKNDQLKARRGIILQNLILYYKDDLAKVKNKKYLTPDMLSFFDDYCKKENEGLRNDTEGLSEFILTHDADEIKEKITDDNTEALDALALNAAYYSFEESAYGYSEDKYDNPYSNVYHYLLKLVNENWTYLYYNPKNFFDILPLNNKQVEKLGNIIDAIASGLDEDVVFESNDSLIILNLLKNKDNYGEEVLNIKLTLREFAIYLYYELKLNKILAS